MMTSVGVGKQIKINMRNIKFILRYFSASAFLFQHHVVISHYILLKKLFFYIKMRVDVNKEDYITILLCRNDWWYLTYEDNLTFSEILNTNVRKEVFCKKTDSISSLALKAYHGFVSHLSTAAFALCLMTNLITSILLYRLVKANLITKNSVLGLLLTCWNLLTNQRSWSHSS